MARVTGSPSYSSARERLRLRHLRSALDTPDPEERAATESLLGIGGRSSRGSAGLVDTGAQDEKTRLAINSGIEKQNAANAREMVKQQAAQARADAAAQKAADDLRVRDQERGIQATEKAIKQVDDQFDLNADKATLAASQARKRVKENEAAGYPQNPDELQKQADDASTAADEALKQKMGWREQKAGNDRIVQEKKGQIATARDLLKAKRAGALPPEVDPVAVAEALPPSAAPPTPLTPEAVAAMPAEEAQKALDAEVQQFQNTPLAFDATPAITRVQTAQQQAQAVMQQAQATGNTQLFQQANAALIAAQKEEQAIAPLIDKHNEAVQAHNAEAERLQAVQQAVHDKREQEIQTERAALPPDIRDRLNANDAQFRSALADVTAKFPEPGPARDAAVAEIEKAHTAEHEAIAKDANKPNPEKEQQAKDQRAYDDLASSLYEGLPEPTLMGGNAERDKMLKQRADDLDRLRQKADQRGYSVDENGDLRLAKHTTEGVAAPAEALAAFDAAERDGLINPQKAPEARQKLEEAKKQYDDLVKIAGDDAKVKAVLRGAGRSGVFMAAAFYGGRAGAALAAPTENPYIVAAASAIGAIAAGSAGQWTYEKLAKKFEAYSDTLKSVNAAAELHPYAETAGDIGTFLLAPEAIVSGSIFSKKGLAALATKQGIREGLTPAVVKSIENYGRLGQIAADGVGKAGVSAAVDAARSLAATNAVLKNVGSAAAGGVLFTAAQYLVDAGRYAVASAFQKDPTPIHTPGFADLAFNVGLGVLLHGRGLVFRDYSAAEVASILARAKVRKDAGIGMSDRVNAQDILDAYKAAGIDPSKVSPEMLRPLTPEEASMYEAASAKVQIMQQSGELPRGTAVDFGAGKQAVIPGMFGKNTAVSSAAVEPRFKKIAGGRRPPPFSQPGLPAGAPPQAPPVLGQPTPALPAGQPTPAPVQKAVKSAGVAASDAELDSYQPPAPTGDSTADTLRNIANDRARVVRDIARGRPLADLQNNELSLIGMKRTPKGEIVPETGTNALPPAISVENGQPIILQPEITRTITAFPATGSLIGMTEREARAKLTGVPVELAPQRTSSTVTSTDETGKIRQEGVSGLSEQSSTGTTAVPEVSRGGNEGVAQNPSPKRGGKAQGELSQHGESVPQTREATEGSVRAVREQGQPNAPLGLQQAEIGDLAVSTVSPSTAQGGTWSASSDKGTVVSIPAADAASAEEAAILLASKVPTGELLDRSSLIPPTPEATAATKVPRPSKTAKVPTTIAERVLAEAAPHVLEAGITPSAKIGAVRAKLLSEAVASEAPGFAGVIFVKEGGPARLDVATGNLEINVAAALSTMGKKSVADARKWIRRVVDEEVKHRTAVELENTSPEWAAGLKEAYDSLTPELKEASRAAYFAQVDKPGSKQQFPDDGGFTARHEFFRQYWQNKSFAGLVEAALAAKGKLGVLRKLIADFIRALRKLAKGANAKAKSILDGLVAEAEAKEAELKGMAQEPQTAEGAPTKRDTALAEARAQASKAMPEIRKEFPPADQLKSFGSASVDFVEHVFKNLDQARKQLAEDTRIYKDIRARGADALSNYDIEIAHGGDAVAAVKTALGLKANHIRNAMDAVAYFEASPEERAMYGEFMSRVDEAAHEAATSPKNDLAEPSDAQKEAGNYQKGHIKLGGLDVSIENPAGSKRRPEWPELKSHYGYIRGTEGPDGDQVDVFIRPGTPENYAGPVFVVNQNKPDGTFDEHKVMVGFKSRAAAEKGYLENYTPGWKGLGSITPLSWNKFKEWVETGDHSQPMLTSAGAKAEEKATKIEKTAAQVKNPKIAEALKKKAAAVRGRKTADEEGAATPLPEPVAAQPESPAPAASLADAPAPKPKLISDEAERMLRDAAEGLFTPSPGGLTEAIDKLDAFKEAATAKYGTWNFTPRLSVAELAEFNRLSSDFEAASSKLRSERDTRLAGEEVDALDRLAMRGVKAQQMLESLGVVPLTNSKWFESASVYGVHGSGQSAGSVYGSLEFKVKNGVNWKDLAASLPDRVSFDEPSAESGGTVTLKIRISDHAATANARTHPDLDLRVSDRPLTTRTGRQDTAPRYRTYDDAVGDLIHQGLELLNDTYDRVVSPESRAPSTGARRSVAPLPARPEAPVGYADWQAHGVDENGLNAALDEEWRSFYTAGKSWDKSDAEIGAEWRKELADPNGGTVAYAIENWKREQRGSLSDAVQFDVVHEGETGTRTVSVETGKTLGTPPTEAEARAAGFTHGPVAHFTTAAPFEQFDASKIGANDTGYLGEGIYFMSDDGANTSRYGDNKVTAMLRLNNPLVLRPQDPMFVANDQAAMAQLVVDALKSNGKAGPAAKLASVLNAVLRSAKTAKVENFASKALSKMLTRAMKSAGYDGVIFEPKTGSAETMVFEPSQVRVIGQSRKLNTAPSGSSVTPEQDAAYMRAVESGDMETAQRMVDEAAKRAGGFFHATDAELKIGDTLKPGSEIGRKNHRESKSGAVHLSAFPEMARIFGEDFTKTGAVHVYRVKADATKVEPDISDDESHEYTAGSAKVLDRLDPVTRDSQGNPELAVAKASNLLRNGGDAIVKKGVIPRIRESKIIDPIVEAIPVDVVNMLGSKEGATDMLLHDPSVLQNALTANRDGFIRLSAWTRLRDEAMGVVTGLRAELRRMAASEPAALDREMFAALDALQNNLVTLLGNLASKGIGSTGEITSTDLSKGTTAFGSQVTPRPTKPGSALQGEASSFEKLGSTDFARAFNFHREQHRSGMGTMQGIKIIPLSQRFNPESNSILYTPPNDGDLSDEESINALYDDLTSDLPSDEDIAALLQFHDVEAPGDYTMGDPGIANPGDDEKSRKAFNVSREIYRDTMLERQNFADWDAAGRKLATEDPKGVERAVLEAYANKEQLTSVMTRAAVHLNRERQRAALLSGNEEQLRNAMALAIAYYGTGTEWARAGFARSDTGKTRDERFAEFVTEAIANPQLPEDRIELEGLPRAADKQRTIDRLNRELAAAKGDVAKVREIVQRRDVEKTKKTREDYALEVAKEQRDKIAKALKKEGLTIDDLLDGRVQYRVKFGRLVMDAMGRNDPQRERAIDLMVHGWSTKEIVRATKLPEPSVVALREELRAKPPALREALAKAIQQGVDVTKIAQNVLSTPAAANAMSWDDALAEADRILEKLIPTAQEADRSRWRKVKRTNTAGQSPDAVLNRAIERLENPKKKAVTPNAMRDLIRLHRSKNGVPDFVKKAVALGADQADAERADELISAERAAKAKPVVDVDLDVEYLPFDLNDKKQVYRAMRVTNSATKGWFDVAQEVWINAILSGPQTHMVNIAGNLASMLWDLTVQRLGETIVGSVTGGNAPKWGEMKHLLKGMLPGIVNGGVHAVDAWSTETDIFDNTYLNNPVDVADELDKAGPAPAISGSAGRIFRIPGRALRASDNFFKTVIGQMEVGAQAFRIGYMKGLRGDDLSEFIASEVATPGSLSWKAAAKKALELTFQDTSSAERMANAIVRAPGNKARELEGQAMAAARKGDMEEARKLIRAAKWLNRTQAMLRFVLPFVRTPVNIFRMGIRKSPLGSLTLMWNLMRGLHGAATGKGFYNKYPAAMLAKHLTEQFLAWLALALLWSLIEGDEDDRKKKWLLVGGRPYARSTGTGPADQARREYGGTYMLVGLTNGEVTTRIPFGRIEPLATTLGLLIDSINNMKLHWRNREKGGELQAAGTIMHAIAADLAGQAEDKTFLRGLQNVGNFLGDIQDPDSGGTGATLNMLKDIGAGFVPNLLKQGVRSLDDYQRSYKQAEWTHSYWPDGSAANPLVDIYGRDVKKGGNALERLFWPIPDQIQPLERADAMVNAWNAKHPVNVKGDDGEQSKYNLPRANATHYKLSDGSPMNRQQMRQFDQTAGQMFQKSTSTITPQEAANPNYSAIERLKKRLSVARKAAKKTVSSASAADRVKAAAASAPR